MDILIEAIRAAVSDDAEPIVRRAGAVACRKILAVLEGAADGGPNEPTSQPVADAPPSEQASSSGPAAPGPAAPGPAPAPAPAAARRIDPALVATVVETLKRVPREQWLDLAITHLRSAVPDGASVAASAPVRFHLIPVAALDNSK